MLVKVIHTLINYIFYIFFIKMVNDKQADIKSLFKLLL